MQTKNKMHSTTWNYYIYHTFIKIVAQVHCLKSVLIRSFSGSYFPVFGLNTERYGVRENAEQNNSEYENFLRSSSAVNN